MFNRTYSAVSTQDESHPETQQSGRKSSSMSIDSSKNRRKSLKATRGIKSPRLNILDSFFNERKNGGRTRWPKCAFLLLAGGLLAITSAVLIKIFQPYDLIFKWKLLFEEGGEIFNLWEKPPVDLYIKIYLFNITNAEAYLRGDEKMNVQEVGPYVYKELMTHEDVVFNDNGTVSTNPKHPLVWQEHLSEGHREDDELMMVNIALLSIAQVGHDKGFFFRIPVNVLIRQTDSQPIIKMTAKEFMFGYATSLTSLGNTLLPGWIYFDKVGLIDRMYDFDTDYETFYTGVDNPSISGLYATYRGSPNLPQWNGEHCSNINLASDGTKFKSFIQPNDTVLFFRKSMCRPQRLVRDGEERKFGSLTGYNYVFEKNALDNGFYEEKNKCFCRKGYCQPRGLIDVTDCYYGFPISLSYPHFMDADPGLLENVTGLTPDESKHSSYFSISPSSGLPLKLSAKIQINMHMRDVGSMANNVDRFSHTTIPMLWFDITMPELPKTLESRFNLYLNVLPYIDSAGFWACLVIGIGCLMFAITRATMKLPQFIDISERASSAGKTKYSKVNLGNVYNPCEMKLIEMDGIIVRDDLDRPERRVAGKDDAKLFRMELNASDGNYALEDEPAISDGEESDGADSKQSTADYMSDDDGCRTLITQDSDLEKALTSEENLSFGDRRRSSLHTCIIGDASSAIDDIGNADFTTLRIDENDVYEDSCTSTSNTNDSDNSFSRRSSLHDRGSIV